MKQSIVFLLGILFIVLTFATLRNSREGFGDPFGWIKKPFRDIDNFIKGIIRFVNQVKALICYLGELFEWLKTATDCITNFFIYLVPCMFVYAIQLVIIVSLSPIIFFCFLIEFAMNKSDKKYKPFVYKKIIDNVRLIPGVNTMCYRCNITPPKKGQKDKLQFPVYPKI
jgi:hypothetical protein